MDGLGVELKYRTAVVARNLIRTTDGKLGIIDFGLMLEITETQARNISQLHIPVVKGGTGAT